MRRSECCAGGSTLVIVGIERKPPSASAARVAGHGIVTGARALLAEDGGELPQRPTAVVVARDHPVPQILGVEHGLVADVLGEWGYGSSRNESPNGSNPTTSTPRPLPPRVLSDDNQPPLVDIIPRSAWDTPVPDRDGAGVCEDLKSTPHQPCRRLVPLLPPVVESAGLVGLRHLWGVRVVDVVTGRLRVSRPTSPSGRSSQAVRRQSSWGSRYPPTVTANRVVPATAALRSPQWERLWAALTMAPADDDGGIMQQLSEMMPRFSTPRTPRAHMAVGLAIYDPSTADGGRVTFKGILDHIDKRLTRRVFRQRLVRFLFDLDHPYLDRGSGLRPQFHVRHIALLAAGDRRQLCIQVARLISLSCSISTGHCGELYVIEGLDNVQGVPAGCFAVVTKTHHAAIDGMSGRELTSAIHDDTPTATPSVPDAPWHSESVPATTELLRRATVNNTTRPMHANSASWLEPFPDSVDCSTSSASGRSRRAADDDPADPMERSGERAPGLRVRLQVERSACDQGHRPWGDDQRRRADDRRWRSARLSRGQRMSCRHTR